MVIVGMPAVGRAGHDRPGRRSPTTGSASSAARWARRGSTVDIPRLVALYQDGRLKLDELISARYPFEQINEAIAASRGGSAIRNVIVF